MRLRILRNKYLSISEAKIKSGKTKSLYPKPEYIPSQNPRKNEGIEPLFNLNSNSPRYKHACYEYDNSLKSHTTKVTLSKCRNIIVHITGRLSVSICFVSL